MSVTVAELRGHEAVEAFAVQTRALPDLEALFAEMEARGFSVGIEGRLRAMVLIARLTGVGLRLDDLDKLRAHLLPVLAQSAHEQAEMNQIIADWISPPSDAGGVAPKTSIRSEVDAVPKRARQSEKADRFGLGVAAGAVAVVVIALAVALLVKMSSGGSTLISAAQEIGAYRSPVIGLPALLDPFWQAILEDILSRGIFAAVVLFAGFALLSWRSGTGTGRLARRFGEASLVDVFRLAVNLPNWFRTIDARRAFDRLKRSRWFDTNRIDVAQTIVDTVHAGGRPVVAWDRLRERPNYVLIVDRAARQDHAGLFANLLETAIRDAVVFYTRYDFTGSLNRLSQVRGATSEDVVYAEVLPFSVVASRHAGERLILFASGEAFFERPGIRRDRSGQQTIVRAGTPIPELLQIREFGAVFLLTPTPRASWGGRERLLQELGFTVLSADVKGIEEVAARLALHPEDVSSSQLSESQVRDETFLDRLRRDALRLTSDIPPRKAEIGRLITQLKTWAGDPEVYTLLAAIAAFPKIEPAFTIALARFVLQSRKGEIDSLLYGRLLRLPWLRDGRMPDWLRIALINGLGERHRELVRRIQMFMLGRAEPQNDGAPVQSLDQVMASFEVARELPRDRLAAAASRIPVDTLPADERIFFSVLKGERLDPEREILQPEAPAIIRERMEAPERRRLMHWRLGVIGLAALSALLQPWIAAGLSAVGTGVSGLSVALSALIPNARYVMVWRVLTLAFTLLAGGLWLTNGMRQEPRPLVVFRLWAIWALFSFPALASPPGHETTGQVVVLAAIAVAAWVGIVSPDLWWRKPSADDALEHQTGCDWITGTLAGLIIVLLWGFTWFAGVLPVFASMEATTTHILIATFIGAAGWAFSNWLMRRWLLGPLYFPRAGRAWLDAAFAGVVALVLAAIVFVIGAGPLSLVLGTDRAVVAVVAGCSLLTAAWYFSVRANLGIRRDSVVWRPAVNAMLLAMIVNSTSWALTMTLSEFRLSWYVVTNSLSYAQILVLTTPGFLTYVLRSASIRRGPVSSSPAPANMAWRIAAATVAYLAAVTGLFASFASGVPLNKLNGLFYFLPRESEDVLIGVWFLFFVPILGFFWPVFRFIGPLAPHEALGLRIPKTGGRRLLDIAAPAALLVALITMVFWLTMDAGRWLMGWSTGTDLSDIVPPAIAAALMYGSAVFIALKGRAAQIEEKAWREGSPRCLIPIAIKAGLVTWGVIIAATVISDQFPEVWRSLSAMAQALKSSIAGTATDSAVEGWSFLPIRIATALPWVLVGATASTVLASSLGGDVRRVDRSQRVREAIIVGIAVSLAAGAAQAIQLALTEKLEGASVLFGVVPLIALAAFACGAVIGFKVPVACRINLMTPLDPIMARALLDLLAQAKVALGSETAARDWVFAPNGDLNGITPAEAVQYKTQATGVGRLLEAEAVRRREETRREPPTPVVIEGGRSATGLALSLVPYLIGRSVQLETIARAMNELDVSGGVRAFAVAAPENECLDAFIDAAIQSRRSQILTLVTPLDILPSEVGRNYLLKLRDGLGLRATATTDQIAAALSRTHGVVSVISFITSEQLNCIDAWMEVWTTLRASGAQFAAMPILALQLPNPLWFQWIIRRRTGNTEIYRSLEQLSHTNAGRSLQLKVLLLSPVRRMDVESWLHSHVGVLRESQPISEVLTSLYSKRRALKNGIPQMDLVMAIRPFLRPPSQRQQISDTPASVREQLP